MARKLRQVNWKLVPTMSALRQRAFLNRAQGWAVTGTGYTPIKILGAGAYGLAVLFRRTGGRRNRRVIPNIPNQYLPSNFVVKQGTSRSFERESKMLLRIEDAGFISGSGSKHIVQIYRSVGNEGGSGTHPHFDPHPFDAAGQYVAANEVYRIYSTCSLSASSVFRVVSGKLRLDSLFLHASYHLNQSWHSEPLKQM
jgi:hypothetical protein